MSLFFKERTYKVQRKYYIFIFLLCIKTENISCSTRNAEFRKLISNQKLKFYANNLDDLKKVYLVASLYQYFSVSCLYVEKM